jgi:putative FmdB family regulatory protein
MPTFDLSCGSCKDGKKYETLLRRHTDPDPDCPVCGNQLNRLLAAPAAIWLGSIGRFGNPTKEYYNPDGVVAYRVNSTRNVDGSPEKVFLRTRRDQVNYCRAEGLRMPDEINSNAEMCKNGKNLSTSGVSGQWTGVPLALMADSDGLHLDGWV